MLAAYLDSEESPPLPRKVSPAFTSNVAWFFLSNSLVGFGRNRPTPAITKIPHRRQGRLRRILFVAAYPIAGEDPLAAREESD